MGVLENISEFIPLGISVIFCVLFASIILELILNIEFFKQFKLIIWIVCFPGVVLHEASHYFFSVLSGSTIIDKKFFYMEKIKEGKREDIKIGGYVHSTVPDSFLANILVSIGPVLINGLVVSIIIYFMTYLHEAIAYYLIFAFTLGALPSTADLKCIYTPFKNNGGRAFFELSSLFISIIPAWFAATWNVNSVHEINWLIFITVYFLTLAGLIGCYKVVTGNS